MTVLTGAGARISAVNKDKDTFSLASTEKFPDFISSAGANGVTYQCVIEDPANGNWEIGAYTFDKQNNTLKRHSVSTSSNSNNAIVPSLGSFIYSASARLYINSPGISGTAIGYGVGVGGAQTQGSSKSTGVTLNAVCGQITMNAASLAATTTVLFTVTNSQVAATDVVNLAIASGNTAGAYNAWVDSVAAGSFVVALRNLTAGPLSEAVKLNFAVMKAVAS